MPIPLVALPWGSASTSKVRRSAMASEAARLTAVVVLPTPPFWFAIETILAIAWLGKLLLCMDICYLTTGRRPVRDAPGNRGSKYRSRTRIGNDRPPGGPRPGRVLMRPARVATRRCTVKQARRTSWPFGRARRCGPSGREVGATEWQDHRTRSKGAARDNVPGGVSRETPLAGDRPPGRAPVGVVGPRVGLGICAGWRAGWWLGGFDGLTTTRQRRRWNPSRSMGTPKGRIRRQRSWTWAWPGPFHVKHWTGPPVAAARPEPGFEGRSATRPGFAPPVQGLLAERRRAFRAPRRRARKA